MRQIKQEIYTSYQDFQRKCFPSMVLDRLDESLCSMLELDEEYQHRLSKSDKNPLAGSLELAKKRGDFSREGKGPIEEAVKRFYEEEGFRVTNDGLANKGFLHARGGQEHYRIWVVEHDTSWMIHVDDLK